jgi:hypothetical protein
MLTNSFLQNNTLLGDTCRVVKYLTFRQHFTFRPLSIGATTPIRAIVTFRSDGNSIHILLRKVRCISITWHVS